MKPPRPKIHLADRDSPILDYSNVEVRCGAVLAHAEPKWMVIAEEFGVITSKSCRKCIAAEPTAINEKKYCYGLVEGQESRDAENLGASEGDNEA